MRDDCFVIGVDYGTDSVRSIIVNASNGDEVASSVFYYPRWKDQLYCNADVNQFRHHTLDYIEGLEQTIKDCLSQAGLLVANEIKAISVDTTGSTPVAVDKAGKPLSLLPGFEDNPNAMFILWKDHTAIEEAQAINNHASKFETNYLKYVGGIYSSEWFWAKLLHISRTDETIRKTCYSFAEHCDWVPFLLTGGTDVHQMKRSVCAAGHKALWSESFNGLPPNEFFASLDPLLNCFTSRLFTKAYTSDKAAGYLSAEWAERLGLSTNVMVGVGAFDAHMGAAGGQIEPYHLVKVMGTSTCDLLVAPINEVKDKLVKGICGQVNGSVIPEMIGMEAGQSAFGDSYAWFRDMLLWPFKNILSNSTIIDIITRQKIIDETRTNLLSKLSEQAAQISLEEDNELALDWLNGRRTPDADQTLKAAITGLDLATDAPKIFRAIVESTCFGAKAIVDRFTEEDIPVKGLIGIGGVAKKSPFIMQMLADVINMPIRIHKSEQTCATGAAMFAATVAGIYPKVEDAMQAMGKGFDAVYTPDEKNVAVYEKRYQRFKELANFISEESV